MPGPFPGMDPYLESPILWPGVHQRVITYLSDALNERMPSHYFANIGERVYVVEPNRSIYPDVMVVERPVRPDGKFAGSGGTAVAERCDAPSIVTFPSTEIREGFIEIKRVGDDSPVVTVIELLSYTNKNPGRDRKAYLDKQEEVLFSDSHLLEIDLLRAGPHTVAPVHRALQTLGLWDYIISLHRAEAGWRYELWPVTLRKRLPRIAVPLADNDPDVVLDLQKVLDRCYDAGVFDRQVNYRPEPDPPLSPEDTAWADALLKEKGRR
ncbi:MAG: DUF4058 family protein [Armatimonadota bacterium]|nr:DUF4058 family protein [Armatimonadota bacterium]